MKKLIKIVVPPNKAEEAQFDLQLVTSECQVISQLSCPLDFVLLVCLLH